MSLIEQAMENCTLLIKTIVPDGHGGYTTVYRDGATFKAAIVLDSSIEARVALASDVTSVYTITTHKTLSLDFHDVFRRAADNRIFRVTSKGIDNKTPTSAGLNMRNVSAEEWELPS